MVHIFGESETISCDKNTWSVEFYPETRTLALISYAAAHFIQVDFRNFFIRKNKRDRLINIRHKENNLDLNYSLDFFKKGDVERIFNTIIQWNREDAQKLKNEKFSISQNND